MIKTVMITGAANGIGKELAIKYANEGYNLALTDIDYDGLSVLQAELNRIVSCEIYACNVRNRNDVEWQINDIIKKFGAIDILINNAGIGYAKGIEHTSIEEWQKLVGINFWGPLYHIYAVLPHMKEDGMGQIVNISSGQAFLKMPSWGAYSTTKAALSVASEIMAFELKKYGISVTTVYPFMVDTPFYHNISGTDTFFGKLSMKTVPYYSHSPKTVAKRIFKAVKKKKRRETISIINDAIYYAQVTPVHTVISKVVDLFLNKKDK